MVRNPVTFVNEPRLRRLAERNLAGRMRRRLDPDDLVQSAFRTFLRRAARHEFELKDRDMLMSLLCTILLNKVRRLVRDHSRQKRGVEREQYFDTLADVQGQNPTPEEQVAFQELEQLIQTMGEDEQLVVSMKLAGHCSKENATELRIFGPDRPPHSQTNPGPPGPTGYRRLIGYRSLSTTCHRSHNGRGENRGSQERLVAWSRIT